MTPTPSQLRAAALAALNGGGFTYAGGGVVFSETWIGRRDVELDPLVAELAVTGFRPEAETADDATLELDLTAILRHATTDDAQLDELAELAVAVATFLANTQLTAAGVAASPERVQPTEPVFDPAALLDHGIAETASTVTYRIFGATA